MRSTSYAYHFIDLVEINALNGVMKCLALGVHELNHVADYSYIRLVGVFGGAGVECFQQLHLFNLYQL